MMKTRLMVFSQQDVFEFEISPNDVFSAPWREGINKEHSLSIVTTVKLRKGQRILFKDKMEKWHEYVVYGQDEGHENDERPFGTYPCVWSLQNDFELFTVNDIPGLDEPVNARAALEVILSETNRWGIGRVEISKLAGADMTRVSGWEALSLLVENWGGEIDAEIEVGNNGVISRKVSIYEKIGNQEAKRRFDYSSDLLSIHRKVEEMPLACRIRPLGKAEKDVDGFDVHVTIGDANDGIDYLQNDQMAEILKMPYTRQDGTVGYEYPIINVENTDIEDPEELLEWGLSVLEEYTTPKVTYSMDVLQLSTAGTDEYGVSLGDMVQSVDRGFSEDGVRISVRVISTEGNLVDDSNMRLTMGNATETYILSVSKAVHQVEKFTFGARTTAQYLDNLLTQLNGQINATGGYVYITQGQGLRTYDKAVSNPLVGSEADAVVEMKGGTIRIANSRDAQGEWDWRTVFLSGHIAADLVTAAQITSGYMQSANGNVYINLDDGKFWFAGLERNLLRNSDFGLGTEHWHGIAATISSKIDEDFGTCLKMVTTASGGYDCRVYSDRDTNFEHEVGTTYSIGFWAKSDSANTISVNCGGYDTEGQSYVYRESVGTTWQKYTGTMTAESVAALSILLGSAGTLYVAEVMLVRGENPQEWAPSEKDIIDARAIASNYLSFDPTNGLDIGYVGTQSKVNVSGGGIEMFDGTGTSSMLLTQSGQRIGRESGKHVSLTSDGMQVLDNTTALLSLLSSSTRIGKESGVNIFMGQEGYMDLLKNGSYLAHIGYGYGENSDKVYYSFGQRKSFDTGMHSFCSGSSNGASGNYSFAAGQNNEVTGNFAVAIGSGNKVSTSNSVSIGVGCSDTNMNASQYSGCVMIGRNLMGSYGAFVCGIYNEAPALEVVGDEYLFIVGSGTSSGNRKNAFFINKSSGATVNGSCAVNSNLYTHSVAVLSNMNNKPSVMSSGCVEIDSTCTASNFVTRSDRRLKEHVRYMDESESSDFIRALKPAMFRWKKDGESLHMGFYAQDVEEADKWGTSTVVESEVSVNDIDNPLSVNYQAIIAPLVAYTQSLEKRIIELEKRLDALEDRA